MKIPSSAISAEMVKEVKELLASELYYQHQIAEKYSVNQGRISEIKNGHYDYL